MQAMPEKMRIELGRKLMRGPWQPFEKIDLSLTGPHPSWLTRAYRNNRYCVMINDYAETTVGYCIRAFIQSASGEPVHNWEDLQRVKNEIFGEDTVAIEYYPKQSEVTNVHHIYWLWIYEPGQIPLPIIEK